MSKNDFSFVLEQIEKDRGIPRSEILQILKDALESSCKKRFGYNTTVISGVDASGVMSVELVKTVVKSVFSTELEIDIVQARKINSETKIGDSLSISIAPEQLSRIAAQVAKQVITHKLRSIRKQELLEKFGNHDHELYLGRIMRFSGGDIFVEVDNVEAILPYYEQVHKETFELGKLVKVLLLRLNPDDKVFQLTLSRRHPDFVKKLFESVLPAEDRSVIEIVKVVRDPGCKTKVLVKSNHPSVDPVGACLGIRGSRVRTVVQELQGERVDVIKYSEDTVQLLIHALSPAKIISVHFIGEQKKAVEVLVPDDMIAMALGKAGSNVRLASQLLGIQVNIQTESQKKKDMIVAKELLMSELKKLPSMTEVVGSILIDAGIDTVEKIANLNPEQLIAFQGIEQQLASQLIEEAKDTLSSVFEKSESMSDG